MRASLRARRRLALGSPADPACLPQIVVGYLVPSYIALLLELRSRHAFLQQRHLWRSLQLVQQGLDPTRLLRPIG